MNKKRNIDLFKCGICGKILGKYEVHTEYFKLIKEDKKIGNLGGFICTKCIVKKSGVKTLYHISKNLDMIKEFIPRVPENRAVGEEAETPRICLSSSIDGCLTAVPWGGANLDVALSNEQLIRVYEFNINDLNIDKLIPPEYLYSKNLVIDSKVTNEYWYTAPVKPHRSYLITVNSYLDRAYDHIKCDDLISGIYSEMDDEYFNWEDVIMGSFVQIYNANYHIVIEEKEMKYPS